MKVNSNRAVSDAVETSTISQAAYWGVIGSHRSGEAEAGGGLRHRRLSRMLEHRADQDQSAPLCGDRAWPHLDGCEYRQGIPEYSSSVAFRSIMGNTGLILTQLKDIS